ncbi:MAG: hypothetical protein EP343_09390 [Deltaproteobacteria bacterium]|nr:MAG: hypothetical protein EP343_09390 [Deltaproteobacteria bacterium]
MRIQRLNMDTSWSLHWGGAKLLIDPWLVGPEVDGFRWFNEQHHAQDPIPIEDLPEYDAILVSQSYEDHCHLKTLGKLEPKPILGPPKVYHRLKSKQTNELALLPDGLTGSWYQMGDLNIAYLAPNRKVDPIYHAILFAVGSEAIFYASHGFTLQPEQLEVIKELNIKLLITTFTHFKLPGLMGGEVNPGLPNAMKLVELLSPEYVLNTHDEQKIGKGLVSKLAKVTYPNLDELDANVNLPFVRTEHYNPIQL